MYILVAQVHITDVTVGTGVREAGDEAGNVEMRLDAEARMGKDGGWG
jgi:hypothetical protein